MHIMDRVDELRSDAATALEEARALVTAAEGEDRDLSEDEQKEYDDLRTKAQRLNARADRLEEQHRAERDVPERRSQGSEPETRGTTQPGDAERSQDRPAAESRGDSPEQFRSFGEFLQAIRFNPSDPRLQDLYAERNGGEETREQSMGTGAEGGFAVPEQFRPDLLEMPQQEGVIRPRAMVIPAGSPPDAEIKMPALDQSGAGQNMYGGVTVDWIDEGDTKPETDYAIKEVSLQPHEVAGHIVLTDKLLRNWQAAGPTAQRLLQAAIRDAEDDAFLQGDGTGKPQGIIGSAAEQTVARDTADEIAYADLTSMLENVIGDGPFVWIANPSVRPQLLNLQDDAGQFVWQPNARDGVNWPLFGNQIVWNRRSPTLGNKGDIMLVDLSQYLVKDGSGPFLDASPHVHFTTNKTVIKAFWNVDGKPWLTGTLTDHDGRTVSPFQILDDPAA